MFGQAVIGARPLGASIASSAVTHFGASSLTLTVTATTAGTTNGTAPESLEEILAGWIATAVTGHTGTAIGGRVRSPSTGSIA